MNANQTATSGTDVAIRTRLMAGAKSSAWIVAVGLVLLVCVGWFASNRHGTTGLLAAAIATGVCLVSAILALQAVAVTAGTNNAVSGTLLSMVMRSAIPFFSAILLCQLSPPLADAGLFGMVLVIYLIVLLVETTVAVRLVNQLSAHPVQ